MEEKMLKVILNVKVAHWDSQWQTEPILAVLTGRALATCFED